MYQAISEVLLFHVAHLNTEITPIQAEFCHGYRTQNACFILPISGFLYRDGRLRRYRFLLKRKLGTNFSNPGTLCGYHVVFGNMAVCSWICFFFQVPYL